MLKRSHARSPTTMLAWKRGWDTRLIGPSSRTPTLPWRQRIWEVWDTQDLLESSFPAKSKFTPTQRKAKHWNSTVSGMHLGISLPTSSVPCHRSTCPIWTLAAHLVESGQMTLSCGVMSILPVTLMGLSSTMTLGHKADPTGSRG